MALDITTLSVKVQAQGINDTAKALDNLALSAEKAEKSADRLGEKFSKSSTGILAIKTAMEGMKDMMSKAFPTDGAQALNRALGELSATLKTIKGKKIDIDVGGIGKDAEVARKGVESLNRSLMEGHNVFQVVGKSLYQLRNMLGGTMLFAALQNTTGGVIALSDAWSLMQAKLKMALGSSEAAKNMQEKLYKAAMTLRVPLDELARLFTRLVPAMKDYGYSAEDALKVTTSLAAALKVSGATMAESASVMLQFSQAMQAGRLNGAEFNAVAEGAPIILRAISLEAGKTRGQLKQMGADGQLGVELIAKTLLKWQPIWEDMAKKMPMTVEAAMGNLTTAFTKFFGIANETFGVTQKLAGAIQWVAENIDVLGKLVGAITAGLIAALIVKLSLLAVVTLSNAAAASALGIAWFGTAGSITVATVATGMLSAALNTLKVNPIILAISAITALGVGIYAFASKSVSPLKEVYDNIDRINEAHPDSKGKFEAFTKEIEKLDKQIADGYRNYEKLKKQQESSFSTESAKAMTEEMKIQAKAIAKLEEAQKLYEQQIGSTKKTASDTHAKFMQEHKVQMQQLDVEGNIKRRMSSTEVEMLKKANELRQEIDLNGEGSQRAQEIRVEVMALANKANEEKRVGDAIDAVTKSTKEAAKAEESLEKKYTKQLNSVNAFIEKQEEELGLRRKLTEAEAEAAKVQEFLDTNKSKGSAVEELKAMREKILANGQMKVTQEELNKAFDIYRSKKLLDTQAAENTRIETANMQDQVEMLTLLNDETYKSVLAIEMRKQALQSLSIAAVEAATNEMKLEQDRIEASKNYSEEDKQKRIQGLQEQIEANDRIIKQYNDLLPLQKQLTEGMFKASQIKMQEIGRSPAQILADGFGEAGKAISTMITAYKDFGKESSAVNAELAGQLEFIQKNYQGEEAAKETTKANQAAADKQIQITSGMYASMAGSAKGFFSENSKGYQMMEKMEKAFRAIELAMAMKNFIQKMFFTQAETAAKVEGAAVGVAAEAAAGAANAASAAPAAIINAAQMPGPLAFAGAAAMIALIAGLGVAVSGGGSTPNISAQRQSQQGTGTVFGDTGAKSESLTKALENISENSDISLQYNEGMLNALKNIEASMVGVTKQVIRQGVQGQVGFAAGMGTTKSEGLTSFAKAGEIGLLLSSVFAPLNAIVGALFSVKKSVVDSGLIQNAQSLAEVMAGGLDVMGYTDIETKKKKFGKTKTSTETNLSELSEELQNQFSNIIIGMGTAVKEAAGVLKMDGEGFTETLNSFVVDIGRISIQGMDAKQIQETLTNVFSKVGDEMAASLFPGLIEFQNVGEGMLETLIRVSSTVATVDGIFNQIGQSIGGVGLEGAAAKLKLVDLAGGLQELSNLTQGFYDNFYTETEKTANKTRLVTEEFKRLGVEMIDLKNPDARINFRTLVESLKDTNQEAYVGLLKLQESVSDLTPEFKETASAVDATEEALSLQDRANKLTMSSTEYLTYQRGKELEAVDKSNVELLTRIHALEDEKDALEKLKTASSGAMSVLEKSVNAQKKVLKKDLDDKVTNLNFVKQYEDRKYEDEKKGLQEAQKSSAAYYDALKTQTDDKYDAEKTVLQEAKKASDAYYDALKESASNQVDAAKTYRDVVKSLFEDINSAVEKLTNSTSVLQQQTYESAKSQLDVALALAQTTGQLPTGDSFKNVLSTLTGNDSSRYSSMFDFQREQLVNAGKLSALGGITGGKLSTAEAQLLAAENNVKAVEDMAKRADINNDLLMTDLDDKHKEDIKAVEDMAKRADAYYDLAIEDLDLKHTETIKILDDQIKQLQDKYDSDIEHFDNMLQTARDQLDIANGTYIATLDVGSALNNFGAALGAYVAAKDIENARLVEQVNSMSKKTTAIDATANKTASDYGVLVEELSQMRADINAGNRAIATNTLTSAKVLSQWDGDGQPETRNVA